MNRRSDLVLGVELRENRLHWSLSFDQEGHSEVVLGLFVDVVGVVDVMRLGWDSSEDPALGDNSGQEFVVLWVDFLLSVILREVLWVAAC